MKRLALLLCIPALLLAGCATAQDPRGRSGGFDPGIGRPNPNTPNVFVEEDRYIVVDQEPIRLLAANATTEGGRKFARVIWALKAGTKYRFTADGINPVPIGDAPDAKCQRLGNGKAFQCDFEGRKPAPYIYKYIVTVENEETGRRIRLDPNIYAEF